MDTPTPSLFEIFEAVADETRRDILTVTRAALGGTARPRAAEQIIESLRRHGVPAPIVIPTARRVA